MLPTQQEFEARLQQLRRDQTESPVVDGKEEFSLRSPGDRAHFVQHVAALANNVERSYLIIGVENRTWSPVGLAHNSPLRDADETQQRMNHILTNRLDPNLSIRYRTYEVDGLVYGLVAVQGIRAPYIISIEDRSYGGDRSRGAPCYIYRGAIYIRHGANSIVANRQSDVLGIVSKAQGVASGKAQPDSFLSACNYVDVDSKDFGHHQLSTRLLELDQAKETRPATSWATFVLYPRDSGCTIETTALKDKLKPDQRIGRGSEWHKCIPRIMWEMLWKPRAKAKEFLGVWRPPSSQNDEGFIQFIRIRPTGHIEIGSTWPMFREHDNQRFFAFVTLIGYLWQLVYLTQAIYHDVGYYGETGILVNLIGTKGTLLDEFAEGWISAFDLEYWLDSPEQKICDDSNIQLPLYTLPLADASNHDVESMIRRAAHDLGSYYGQDRPGCFHRDTGDFPAREYTNRHCR